LARELHLYFAFAGKADNKSPRSKTMNTILKTFIMTTMAVAAFGADAKMGFQVEFPFHVGKTVMPAGQYTIERTETVAPVLVLRNANGGKSVLVQFANHSPAEVRQSKHTVEFGCGSSGCSITKVSNLTGGMVYRAFVKKDQTQLVAVQMVRVVTKAD